MKKEKDFKCRWKGIILLSYFKHIKNPMQYNEMIKTNKKPFGYSVDQIEHLLI